MDYKGMTVFELDLELVALKEARSLALKAEKEKEAVQLRDNVAKHKKGDIVTIVFKGEEVEAVFDKVTEKRFTVEIDGVKKSIMFDKYIG